VFFWSRAACHLQLGNFVAAVADTTTVLEKDVRDVELPALCVGCAKSAACSYVPMTAWLAVTSFLVLRPALCVQPASLKALLRRASALESLGRYVVWWFTVPQHWLQIDVGCEVTVPRVPIPLSCSVAFHERQEACCPRRLQGGAGVGPQCGGGVWSPTLPCACQVVSALLTVSVATPCCCLRQIAQLKARVLDPTAVSVGRGGGCSRTFS
jgi:hypothetical protein